MKLFLVGLLALAAAGVAAQPARVQPSLSDLEIVLPELERDEHFEPWWQLAEIHRPELRAALERWRAARAETFVVGRLPDPMLDVGAFAWTTDGSAEPGLSRVVLRQELPWPSERRAERDAADAEADAVEARFRATWLSVRREVVDAVMELWAVDRLLAIDREQLEITGSIADATLGALRIGEATLADQQQVELQRARLEDRLAGRAEQRRIAEARLRATLGLGTEAILPALPSTRPPTQPAESEEDLAFAQLEHPMVQMPTAMAAAAEAMERRHRALALPGLGVGVEWMQMPGAMGDRAVSPMISLRLPFAGRRHRTSAHGADAQRLAWEAERQAAANDTAAALTEALILVRDSARRIATLTTTLIPQADAVGSSRLGAYRVGRGMVGDALMAQRELVELRGELVEAEREHELAWAMLEEAVGRPVRRRTAEAGGVVTHLEDGSGAVKEPRPQDAEREETP